MSTRVIVFLATFQDDFFHKEAGDGQVDGADGYQPPCFFAVEGGEAGRLFGAVGVEDEVEEGGFFFF